jgi:hypothetical protein
MPQSKKVWHHDAARHLQIIFFAFVWFLDGTTYSPSDNITFPQQHILLITNPHVSSFLIYKAYGNNLTGDQEELITCSSTLLFYKKAILHFMTRQRQQWDDISQQGNPTKSAADLQVIKDLKKRR